MKNVIDELEKKVRSQFHNGSITTKNTNLSSTRFTKVSIPQWFDYNSSYNKNLYIFMNRSQFHNGSITTLEKSNQFLRFRLVSQFHNGSITTGRTKTGKQYGKFVSIPQWFDYNFEILQKIIKEA